MIVTTTSREKLATPGRVMFAVALAAFGVQQFIYGDFVPGRAPAWPAAIPGRLIWATLSGAIFIATGIAIISGKKAREAAILSGTMIFVWAVLRHLPELADPRAAVLTATGKSLAMFGGALAVAGSLPASETRANGALAAFGNSTDGFMFLGRLCLGGFMIYSGIQHFIYTEFVATLIPTWIPGPRIWTYFAGVALIAGGGGLIVRRTVRPAAALTGVMLFLWVLLLHIPRALAAANPRSSRNEWTAVFEALAMCGIAFVLAGSVRARRAGVSRPEEPSTDPRAMRDARADSSRVPLPR